MLEDRRRYPHAEYGRPLPHQCPARFAAVATRQPDANGLYLPDGYSSEIVAVSGQAIAATGYVFSGDPDGAGTFEDPDVGGGWYLAVNHESLAPAGGGVSTLRFDPAGEVVDAYRLLGDTNLNCAGGITPWGTWLSCEELEGGRVFECDPTVPDSGEDRPALGRFFHEAVCVDPEDGVLYLTEDRPDGLFYRFTPRTYPDLGDGLLEAAEVDREGNVTWLEVPDPSGESDLVRLQLPDARQFDGGEGIVFGETSEGRRVWFTTKGDDMVRELDPATDTMRIVYRPTVDSTLRGVDNIWWDERSELLYVAEDGGDQELVLVDLTGAATALLALAGHTNSEITGPTMNPDRTVLHFSSQRGADTGSGGVTYAVRGPFPDTRTA